MRGEGNAGGSDELRGDGGVGPARGRVGGKGGASRSQGAGTEGTAQEARAVLPAPEDGGNRLAGGHAAGRGGFT